MGSKSLMVDDEAYLKAYLSGQFLIWKEREWGEQDSEGDNANKQAGAVWAAVKGFNFL